MPITISGSTGIAGVDGSAGTPAVQGTDTNTGIFFPAADTIAFGEGGSERMRIDSSGNVGIGTSSPGNAKLNTQGFGPYRGNAYTIASFAANSALAPLNIVQATDGTIPGISAGQNSSAVFNALGFYTSEAERMRIDTSGNVGIGTSSPGSAYRLAVSGNNTGMSIQDTGSVGTWLDFKTGSGTVQGNIYFNFTNGYMTFGTAAAGSSQVERARIDSSGVLLVGTTTGLAGHTFQNSSGASTYRPTTTTGFGVHHFYSDVSGTSTLKAYVQADGTYINASDEKLKTNIVKARSYLNDLMRIEIVNYTWKGGEDNEKKIGVIAQQVESVFPSLVKEVIGSPATGETQKMLPQEVFIPMLITAIQELKADNDAMKERIATLEAK
jgi:hypothetical protein